MTRKPRIIYNDDSVSLKTVPGPLSEASVARALAYLAGSQVDCLCWEMFDWIAYSWRSDVMENHLDLLAEFLRQDPRYYDNRSDDGPAKALDRNLIYFLDTKGVDYLPLLIGRAHDNDILFFGSFRMNDCHMKSEPGGCLVSRFWREHQHSRLWEVQDGHGYYNAALDYSDEEVRAYVLNGVREVVRKYDVDGIELDFCRNPYLFPPSQAWEKRHILTELVASVRRSLVEIGDEKGKPLLLIVRSPFERTARVKGDQLRRAGMDLEGWIERDLMDMLVMSQLSNNYDVSLDPWLGRCRARNVLFYPSIEGPMTNPYPDVELPDGVSAPRHSFSVGANETSEESIRRNRGMAQQYHAQGADGVYLFNYACKLFSTDLPPEVFDALVGLLQDIGEPGTLAGKAKQYLFWHDLPIYVEAGRPAEHHQTIRFHVRDDRVSEAGRKVLSFRRHTVQNPHAYAESLGPFVPDGAMQTVLNGRPLNEARFSKTRQAAGRIPSGFTLGAHEKLDIRLSENELVCGENSLEFSIPRFPKNDDPYVYIYELTVDVG